MLKNWRRVALLTIDLSVTVATGLLAFGVRFLSDGRAIPPEHLAAYFAALPLVLPARAVIYYVFGLYSQMWQYASIPELIRLLTAATVETLVATVIIHLMPGTAIPNSVSVLAWFFTVAALVSVRLGLRLRREYYASRRVAGKALHRVLIFGAGDAGAMLAREYVKHPEMGCTLVGFVDDAPRKQGYYVAGVPVLGTREQLQEVVAAHQVTHLVIAMPSVKGHVVREVVEEARRLGLQLKTVPGLFELVNGAVSVSQVRDVQIEDLLRRDEVKVDLEAIAAYLTGETVLVTGAGGSIGSELCRQVARFKPRQLLLLGHGENSIYEIDLELRRKHPELDIRPIIADIQDETRIRRVFESFRPGVVFHAAAHKHVPLMECNPEEAIKNNVFGTLNVARAADFYKAKRFVLISSDKAVNPSSVMGATKRAAECVIQSLASTSKTVFVAVRFGNVLGSRGSVIPLFRRQIAAGGPVTVTDPKMVRYFMTIPEAVQLVVQAASMGKGGEIFVLNMGKPVRIVDLARDLIRLSGFEPDEDIRIEFTGIREGEKLYEELLTAEEGTVTTRHERILVAPGNAIPLSVIMDFVESMRQSAATGQVTNEWIRSAVSSVVAQSLPHDAIAQGD